LMKSMVLWYFSLQQHYSICSLIIAIYFLAQIMPRIWH
jgi:hypothetical protein